MKRVADIVFSLTGLVGSSPILLPAILAVWLQDGHSPFYIAPRAGQGGRSFRMVKLRSMKPQADASGGTSTARNDPRITAVGRLVRRWKLDELTQLWNVLRGDMTLVGPRPQVPSAVERYTADERRLLVARPGITDLASIVFADEGEILEGSPDPDLKYDQLIRPWKLRLGLLYLEHGGSALLDLRIILLTIRLAFDRKGALRGVARLAEALGADPTLVEIAGRRRPLLQAGTPTERYAGHRASRTRAW